MTLFLIKFIIYNIIIMIYLILFSFIIIMILNAFLLNLFAKLNFNCINNGNFDKIKHLLLFLHIKNLESSSKSIYLPYLVCI